MTSLDDNRPNEVPYSAQDGLGSSQTGQWITPQELAALSKIRRGRVLLQLALTWASVFLAFQTAIWMDLLVVDVLAFIIIGCLQNAFILWTHEASHYGLSRKKRLNDLISDLFISGPTGITVAQYRWQHMTHHRYLGDPGKEIDLAAWICVRGGHLYSEMLRHLVGVYVARVIHRYRKQERDLRYANLPKRSVGSLIGFVVGNGVMLAMCAWQAQWYLYFLLWVLPLFTLTLLIANFRTVVEHQPSSEVCDAGLVPVPPVTRVIRCNLMERVVVAPMGFYYHYEHHLFPSVPYHRLPELRKLLKERGCFDDPDIVWTDGYLKTLWRLARTPGYGVRVLNPLHGLQAQIGSSTK